MHTTFVCKLYVYSEIITMNKLINISVTSHCCHIFLFVVRILENYSQEMSSIRYGIINYSRHAVH